MCRAAVTSVTSTSVSSVSMLTDRCSTSRQIPGVGCGLGSRVATASMRCQCGSWSVTFRSAAYCANIVDHSRNEVPLASRVISRRSVRQRQPVARSLWMIPQETASTARWWTMSNSWRVRSAHSPCTMAPRRGSRRLKALANVVSEKSTTGVTQSAALIEPVGRTMQLSASSVGALSTCNRSMACRSTNACSNNTTSLYFACCGPWNNMVWLNSSVGAVRDASHRMIGVAVTGPASAGRRRDCSGTESWRAWASRATVRSTRMSRGLQYKPTCRARDTT